MSHTLASASQPGALAHWQAGGPPDRPIHRLGGWQATWTLWLAVPFARAAANGSAQQGAPFFGHSQNRVIDGLEPLLQLEAVGIQRWFPIISDRTPDGQTVATNRFGILIGSSFQASFNGTHPTDLFLEFFLGMPISFRDRFGSFSQIVKMTELVGSLW